MSAGCGVEVCATVNAFELTPFEMEPEAYKLNVLVGLIVTVLRSVYVAKVWPYWCGRRKIHIGGFSEFGVQQFIT